MSNELSYQAFRRRMAYGVPVNELGNKLLDEQYQEFKKGFDAGIAAAAFHLEQMHRQNKHIHKFYLFAQEEVRKLK